MITNVTPDSGPEAGGNTVTISGSGFCSYWPMVYFGSEAATISFISDTQLQAVVPPSVTGQGQVDVIYQDGSGCNFTCVGCYTYN